MHILFLQQQPVSDNRHLSWTCHEWLQGQRWGLHVVEAPWAWLLAATYIAATVISSHPPFISIAKVSSVYTLPALHVYTLLSCLKRCTWPGHGPNIANIPKRFVGNQYRQTTSVSFISNP